MFLFNQHRISKPYCTFMHILVRFYRTLDRSVAISLLKCLTATFRTSLEKEKGRESRAKQYFWDDVSALLLLASCLSLTDGQREICSVINHTLSSWQCKTLPGLGDAEWFSAQGSGPPGSWWRSRSDAGVWPMRVNWTAGPSPGWSGPEESGFPRWRLHMCGQACIWVVADPSLYLI